MQTLKQITAKLTLLITLITTVSCSGPDYERLWKCKKKNNITIEIIKLSDKTYELKFAGVSGASVSGSVEDGVLAVNMFGNVERFSIKGNELKWTGVFADECSVFEKD